MPVEGAGAVEAGVRGALRKSSSPARVWGLPAGQVFATGFAFVGRTEDGRPRAPRGSGGWRAVAVRRRGSVRAGRGGAVGAGQEFHRVGDSGAGAADALSGLESAADIAGSEDLWVRRGAGGDPRPGTGRGGGADGTAWVRGFPGGSVASEFAFVGRPEDGRPIAPRAPGGSRVAAVPRRRCRPDGRGSGGRRGPGVPPGGRLRRGGRRGGRPLRVGVGSRYCRWRGPVGSPGRRGRSTPGSGSRRRRGRNCAGAGTPGGQAFVSGFRAVGRQEDRRSRTPGGPRAAPGYSAAVSSVRAGERS